MTGNRGAMPPSSDDGPIRSDLAKVDSHEPTESDYDEIPELTDEMVARADVYIDGQRVRRGLWPAPSDPVTDERGGWTRKAG